ncbi:Uncharacterised protein [Mycobacterium tuberculosis]|nr:Uncharacterised protein [Mycobacterium tuberculosis]
MESWKNSDWLCSLSVWSLSLADTVLDGASRPYTGNR